MPVPSSISDLSATPSLNSPAGTESPSTVDDYLRTQAAFIRQVDDKATGMVKAVDLAATGGSHLVGYDGGTAQDVLDEAKPMANYTALRAYTGRATGIRITQTGLAGFFQRDDADTTSADNGGTIIVDASGRRWKRLHTPGAVALGWFESAQAAMNSGALSIYVGSDAAISGVTVPASVVEIHGPGRLLAAANDAPVLQLLTDVTRAHTKRIGGGLRISANGKTGTTGIKIGSTTNNPSAGAQEAVLYLNMDDLLVDGGFATGIDSQVTMEKSCRNVVVKGNTVGMKLYGDAVNGGGNANDFTGVRFQGNTVGAMIVSTANYPLHNNVISGGTFQENTVCGLYVRGFSASGSVAGLTLIGTHFEGNATGAATATIDGYTISRSDIHAVRSTIVLRDMDLASSASPFCKLETSSSVHVENVTGYGNQLGDLFQCDSTSVAYEHGFSVAVGTKNVQSYGVLTTVGKMAAYGAPLVRIGQYLNQSPMPNPAIPLLDNTDGVTAVGIAKDAEFGLVSTCQFAASVGSTGTNRSYWYAGVGTAGEYFIQSFLVQASADTTIRFSTLLDGTHKVFDVAMKAGQWQRIVVTGVLVSTTGLQTYIHPLDSVGATLSFKAHQYLHTTDLKKINDVYNQGLCGVVSQNYEMHTAAPTFGTWKRGEVVWNSAPAAAGAPGWVCVTAGTPGTWKAMSNLSA